MLQIPLKPISPKSISIGVPNDQYSTLVQDIQTRRLQLQPLTTSSTSNIGSTIAILEDYINAIYSLALTEFPEFNYLQIAQHLQSVRLVKGFIPWSLPFSDQERKNKKKNCDDIEELSWSISDEIYLVVGNLSTCYSIRANMLIQTILEESKKGEENDKQWVLVFKLYKKSLTFLKFLTSQEKSSRDHQRIYELSSEYIMLLDTTLKISIQCTFLIKSLLLLSQFHYDIDDVIMKKDNNINYSTMMRISVFIKNELSNLKVLLHSGSKMDKEYEKLVKNFNNINEIFLGVFLAVELYKKDQLGDGIAALNHSIDLIASKKDTGIDTEESKIKIKLSKFKNKLKTSSPSNNSKIEINKNHLIESPISNPLQFITVINLQYQIISNLHYKLQLQNNSMNFQKIPLFKELKELIPLGRPVPITENSYWIPSFVDENTSTTTTTAALAADITNRTTTSNEGSQIKQYY